MSKPKYDVKRYQELVRLGEERGLTREEFEEIVHGIGMVSAVPYKDKSGLQWKWSKTDYRYRPSW